MLPDRIIDSVLYIEGRGYAGKTKDVKLPVLEYEADDFTAGGMAGAVALFNKLKAMKLEFTLHEHSPEVLKTWGIANPAGLGARIMGAEVSGDGSITTAIEISVRGRWQKLDLGGLGEKKGGEMPVEMPLTYLRYSRNSEVVLEVDVIGNKLVVGGVDLTAKIRAALGQV